MSNPNIQPNRTSPLASPPRSILWRCLVSAATAGVAWLALSPLRLDEVLGLRAADTVVWSILIGALAGVFFFPRLVVVLATGCLTLLLLVGYTPIIRRPVLALIRADSLPAAPDTVDAVMVLSAAVNSDGKLSVSGAERLLSGLGLIRLGVSHQLVLSRVWSDRHQRGVSSDQDQRRIILGSGLMPVIWLLDSVGTTRHEAERLRDLARVRGWHRIAVVTSPTHTRRACATVEGVGLTVICRPSEDRSTALRSLSSPTDRYHAFGEWVYETLGWWKYRWEGWITHR